MEEARDSGPHFSGQWKLEGLFLPLPPDQVFTHHSLVLWEVAEVLCLLP